MDAHPTSLLLSVDEAAAELRVSRRTMYRLIANTEHPIPTQTVAGKTRIKRADLIRHLDKGWLRRAS